MKLISRYGSAGLSIAPALAAGGPPPTEPKSDVNAPAANVVTPAASSLSSREDAKRGESELRADAGAMAFDLPPYSITEATFTMQ